MKDFPKLKKRFMGFLDGVKRSPNTIASYGFDLDDFGRFASMRRYQTLPLSEDLVAKYLLYLAKEQASFRTIRRRTVSLKAFLRYLNTVGHEFRLEKLATPDHRPAMAKVPTEKALARLLELNPLEHRGALAGQLVYGLGFTVQQLETLRWDDLVVDREIIRKRDQDWGVGFAGLMNTWRQSGGSRNLVFSCTRRMLELDLKKVHRSLNFRKLRHACAVRWKVTDGLTLAEIQHRLGLKTGFSLSLYDKYTPADSTV